MTPQKELTDERIVFTLRALGGAAMLLLALGCGGCTAIRLQRGTISQSSTLTEIQYQQILDNLAMFACNPNSLAWHVKLNGGVVQVADQGGGAFGLNLGGPQQWAPSLTLQRNVLHQWNVDPVIDADDLELLQIAYRKAVDPNDLEGTIRHDAFEQICEISTECHIALTRDVSTKMIAALRENKKPEEQAKLDKVKAALEKLYERLETLMTEGNEFDAEKVGREGYSVPSELEFVQEEILKVSSSICDAAYVPLHSLLKPRRSPGLLEQAQDQIAALLSLVDEPDEGEPPNPYSMHWVHVSCCKKDIPPCTCFVGRYCHCGQTCYAWVMPDQAKTLRDFALVVLSLAPPDAADVAPQTMGLGAANSPGF
ncbi:MAG TPA: hypothetical protein VGJ26_18670 [Pirellulales bacterium]|jgi:hypothetical protein